MILGTSFGYSTLAKLAHDVSAAAKVIAAGFHVEHNPDNTHGAITATSINIASGGAIGSLLTGTYTPTLTNTTNISASTATVCHYFRLGDLVHVAGRVDIDATAAAAIALGMSLPIASDFGTAGDLGGVASSPGSTAAQALGITADSTNDRATFAGVVADTSNTVWSFTFTYRVI